MQYFIIFLIIIPLLALVAFLMTEKGHGLKELVQLYATGLDSGFSPFQIHFLSRIGRVAELEDITSLFWSVSSLDKCIAEIVTRSKQTGTENTEKTQQILSRLYTYRTKIELEQAKKKHGLDSTRDIVVNQRIRILLKGTGVFSSKIVRNGPKNLVIDFPTGSSIPGSSIDWSNRQISVYFWRHDDAGYVFDSTVLQDPTHGGKALLSIAHSWSLVRSQKRKSIRVKCSMYAQMYLVKPGDPIDTALEPEPGMKCLLEDLSEDGAMIVIGGKAVKNMRIKLQFLIHDVLIVMTGSIRAVEYNQETNQSRIHFESDDLSPRMKNAILTFVYNVLPAEDKEELEAIRLTEEDGLAEAQSPEIENAKEGTEHNEIDSVELLPELPDFAK
jgi:c-di-GMP-binding flagellar brake protein YcgR